MQESKYIRISCILFATAAVLISCSSRIQFDEREVEAKRWVKGEPNQPWQMYQTRYIQEQKKIYPDKQNVYGSTFDIKGTRTGFFHVEKIGGRWWTIDPQGYANIQRTINCFRQGTSERNQAQFAKKFQSVEDWTNLSAKWFSNIGINGIGSWSNHEAIIRYNERTQDIKLSYAVNLRLMAAYGKKRGGVYQLPGNIGFPNQTIFVFDPEFPDFCKVTLTDATAKLKNDPNLLGYFSDNELPFGTKNLEGYLSLSNPNDPGRIAAEKWMQKHSLSIEQITDKERNEFAGFVAETYFSIVRNALKEADSNHMYLGSRLHGKAKFIPEIMQAAGKYCDAVSINYYGVWTPVEKHLQQWSEWTQKPFFISEFYTKAMDSGLANTTGAGYTVYTQKDRGYAYQDFCIALLECNNCIGWHYFRYQDNDPTTIGVDPSNIDSNKGIVNNNYDPYTDLTEMMQQLNKQVYSIIQIIHHQ